MRVAVAMCLLVAPAALAGSANFTANAPTHYEFLDQPVIPAGFGVGEFTLEFWIRPDASRPVGPVWRASYAQLENWSDADPRPYSAPGWWLPGNWLLDGHTRPRGYGPNDTREGTFSLQFYGGGRLRWMFADADLDLPGKVYAVQAWPADSTGSLLDGEWHHVAAVRRWTDDGARLELWIDGVLVGTADLPGRTDMRRFWDRPSHPDDPAELGGWAWGAEVMTAWRYAFTQYEDYKGLLDEVRFWNAALDAETLRGSRRLRGDEPGLAAWFDFSKLDGDAYRDRVDPAVVLRAHRWRPDNHSDEEAPLR